MAPAHTDEQGWKDPRGGESSYLDLYSATVRNTAEGVRIRWRMHPLDWVRYSPEGKFSLTIDTGGSAGPEFEESMGFPGHGGFRALKGNQRWKKKWLTYGRLGVCGKTVLSRYRFDEGVHTLLIKPKRGCLYRPKRVRIKMRSVEWGYYEKPGYRDYVKNTPPLADHFPTSDRVTPWVKYSRR